MLHRMVEVQDLNAGWRILAYFLPDPLGTIGHDYKASTLATAHLIHQGPPEPTKIGRLGKGCIVSRLLDTVLAEMVGHPQLDLGPLFVHKDEHPVHGGMQALYTPHRTRQT